MKRVENWEAKLADAVHSALKKPFAWGEHDCCLFACTVVAEITGEDMAHDFRGRYKSKAGAARVVKEFAGAGLAELAAKRAAEFGLEEVPVAFAQRGDVVLVEDNGNDALGVVADYRAACAGKDGLRFVTRDRFKKAWRV